jgi:hypothetical protein
MMVNPGARSHVAAHFAAARSAVRRDDQLIGVWCRCGVTRKTRESPGAWGEIYKAIDPPKQEPSAGERE